MKEVIGDIVRAKEKYIVQQCNCLSIFPYGLAKTLSKAFPKSCPYQYRRQLSGNIAMLEDRDIPGHVTVIESKDKFIVNLFGQVAPGKPKTYYPEYLNYYEDTSEAREGYFKHSLDAWLDFIKESKEENVTIAVPYKIGCGLAGGNWEKYKQMLLDFEKSLQSFTSGNLTMYILKSEFSHE